MKVSQTSKDVTMFLEECAFYGFEVQPVNPERTVVAIHAHFNPFNDRRFSYLEHEGQMLLMRYGAGHLWGTEGIAAGVALEKGKIEILGSQFGVRFIRELAKRVNQQKGA